MNMQEAVEYNVKTLEAHLGGVLCRSRWMPQDSQNYGEAAEVFGIVDRDTARLKGLFYSGGAPERLALPYILTSLTVSAQRKPRGKVARLFQKLRNRGRRTHQITDWTELADFGGEKALPEKVREILQASRTEYNSQYGFRT